MRPADEPAPAPFGPATAAWFAEAFAEPTAVQRSAWSAIATGADTLIVAPTGSGKTLAAFLQQLDRLTTAPTAPTGAARRTASVLYISPLKALAVDVDRNLRAPLAGIARHAARRHRPIADVSTAIRTGDTPARDRQAMLRRPPSILITTPESLFLMLTSRAAQILAAPDVVIIDEIHALAGNKRGSHLAVSLERLDDLSGRRAQRIGLSATVRPVEEVARFLTGAAAPATVVQSPLRPAIALRIEVPVPDLTDPGASAGPAGPGAPADLGVWPHVVQRIDADIRSHRSTLVFTNSRRLAERITGWLNDPDPGASLARAHHGSVSKDQRMLIEADLKAGTLPAVVATSSLELGIDMGAIDLVVQVESPPSVASGLQRVGRAGHGVGQTSSAVLYPKHRGDLLTTTVVAQAMAAGDIEPLSVPRNPLDVLAQHVMAALVAGPRTADDVHSLVRRAAPFRDLSRDVFDAVLDMLDGAYPSSDFADLRARLVWDRTTGTLTARPGAQRLVIGNAGTIPDRGMYTVLLSAQAVGGNRRVGELDEEMVYESRVGDVFRLGAGHWRIEEITPDRVLVSPAPGRVARLPYWHGDSPARPFPLGERIGAFLRAHERHPLDEDPPGVTMSDWARENLRAYLVEQRAATGALPTDRRIVVERFRDELGDWRVVVHSVFGARVNAAWAQVIGLRLQQQWGLDAQVMAADDGIVARLPDVEDESLVRRIHEALFPLPGEAVEVLTAHVADTALFAARFRECAARALLLPGRFPGRRRPLWQQRQRAAHLLAVASAHPRFPITLEAARECLQDVYDVPALRRVLDDIAQQRIHVLDVETPAPSPFARSLLFAYLAEYMYGGDAPLAERRAAALELDPALLAELLGDADLSDVLDPVAVAAVVEEAQWLAPSRRARDLESTADMLRELGPLTPAGAERRGAEPDWLTTLITDRRAFSARIHGVDHVCDVRDAAALRDGLGVVLPADLPTELLAPRPGAVSDLVARHLATNGPTTVAAAAADLGIDPAAVALAVTALVASGRVLAGTFMPDLPPAQIVDARMLQRLRRRSIAALQAQAEPVDHEALARFLVSWHGLDPRPGAPLDEHRRRQRLLDVVDQLAGLPVPLQWLERTMLPLRVPGYRTTDLDALTVSGEVAWWGVRLSHGSQGWVVLAPVQVAADLRPAAAAPPLPTDPLALQVLGILAGGGAWFAADLLERLRGTGWAGGTDALAEALWGLVWCGLVGNDSLEPARSWIGADHRPRPSRPARPGRWGAARPAVRALPPVLAGRWSAVRWTADTETSALTAVLAIIGRHGVVTKGAVSAESLDGGFGRFYRTAAALQERGTVSRLYLVQGLGGSPFADRSAIERVRAHRDPGGEHRSVVLASTDPANPFGAAVPWPDGASGHRPSRVPGSFVVCVDGAAVIYLERGGHTLITFPAAQHGSTLAHAAGALAAATTQGMLRPGRRDPAITRIDGRPVADAEVGGVRAALEAAGYRPTPSGWRITTGPRRTS